MQNDYTWLFPYSEYISNKIVLELGASIGIDTYIINGFASEIYVIEKDEYSLEILKQKIPNAKIICGDFRDVLPVFDKKINTVIASLSLHYFSNIETKQIISNLYNILEDTGTLIVRVNSSNDVNYGAVGFPKIEEEYFNINGMPKRFFSNKAIENYFNPNWEIIEIKEKSIDRYTNEKIIWEFIAKKKIN